MRWARSIGICNWLILLSRFFWKSTQSQLRGWTHLIWPLQSCLVADRQFCPRWGGQSIKTPLLLVKQASTRFFIAPKSLLSAGQRGKFRVYNYAHYCIDDRYRRPLASLPQKIFNARLLIGCCYWKNLILSNILLISLTSDNYDAQGRSAKR